MIFRPSSSVLDAFRRHSQERGFLRSFSRQSSSRRVNWKSTKPPLLPAKYTTARERAARGGKRLDIYSETAAPRHRLCPTPCRAADGDVRQTDALLGGGGLFSGQKAPLHIRRFEARFADRG
nr:MAG TPA: hypothetical protein [Caudoviricetes sp.]